ncbi:MAG: HAD family hydrolase, partial [Alloalcanivorax xenomutans]
MSYDLVIFDWDGTVMDSTARIVTCMHDAARDLD